MLTELAKAGTTLTPTQQKDWLTAFKTEKEGLPQTEAQITATDKQINDLAYELYGLTENERAWVERMA